MESIRQEPLPFKSTNSQGPSRILPVKRSVLHLIAGALFPYSPEQKGFLARIGRIFRQLKTHTDTGRGGIDAKVDANLSVATR